MTAAISRARVSGLEPRKLPSRSPFVLGLARRYVRRRIRRDLEGLWVDGLDRVRPLLEQGPVVLAINHVSWWDPMVLVVLDELMGSEGYALMDAGNLRRMPWFAWLGALPLDRREQGSARQDLAAGARVLDRPGRSMWIFPQGRQRPAHLRPLQLKAGVRYLAEAAEAPVVPVAISYAFREAEQPGAFVHFGPARAATEAGPGLMPWLEVALSQGLGVIDTFVDTGAGSFEAVIARRAPRRSQDGLGARVLAWVGNLSAGGTRA